MENYKIDLNLIFPTAYQILDNPSLFNQWMININGIKLLKNKPQDFSAEYKKYYLFGYSSGYYSGELWVCREGLEKYPFRYNNYYPDAIEQITDNMARDYGDTFHGHFYLKKKFLRHIKTCKNKYKGLFMTLLIHMVDFWRIKKHHVKVTRWSPPFL